MKGHYIAFTSINYVLMAENLLKKEQIKYKLVPTPRVIDLSCGISIMYRKEDEKLIDEKLKQNGIIVKGFYSIE